MLVWRMQHKSNKTARDLEVDKTKEEEIENIEQDWMERTVCLRRLAMYRGGEASTLAHI